MGRLEGKVAVVTGAGRVGNIGVAVARAFLREGAKAVVGTDFRRDQAAEIEALVRADGSPGSFVLMEQDVTSEADWARVTDAAVSGFGQIDVLVNNAGISIHPGVTMTPILREGLEDYVSKGMWESTAAAEAALAAMNPLGVSSEPEDTAHAFVYLASDEARFVTGASICHDGAIGLRY